MPKVIDVLKKEDASVGDEVKGIVTGKGYRSRGIFIWWQCPSCKREYWKSKYDLIKSKTGGLCFRCCIKPRYGENHPNWKGGKRFSRGYVLVKILPEDPYYSMADRWGYIPEHRLLVAQCLGRKLKRTEIVHHLNGIKVDNRKENLTIVNRHNHESNTFVKQLQKRIRELEQLHLRI